MRISSVTLGNVVSTNRLPCSAVIKKMWAYIKGHQLKNPEDKLMIYADEKIMAIFEKGSVDSFEMMRLISKHL